MSGLSRLRNMFRVPDLRNKIFFTIFIIVIFRLGSHIPVPYVDFHAIQELKNNAESTGGVVGFLDLFSGGALTNVAVFFLGIMPYITASIIMQLLGVVIPKLEEWQNEGQTGQKKITQWTRYLTVGLALMQSTGFVFVLKSGKGGLLGSSGLPGPGPHPELHRRHGRAHRPHVDRRYRARHVARRAHHPARHRQRHVDPDLHVGRVAPAVPGSARSGAEGSKFQFFVIIVIGVGMIVGIVVRRVGAATNPRAVRETCRRPPHVRRPEHLHPAEGQPVGCDPGDLRELVALVPGDHRVGARRQLRPACRSGSTTTWSNHQSWFYIGFYTLLILFFAYFYTAIAFNPAQQADIIRKQGGFIPGIRPGPPTERYLAKVLNRITLPGALFLTVIAVMPMLVLKFWNITSSRSAARRS